MTSAGIAILLMAIKPPFFLLGIGTLLNLIGYSLYVFAVITRKLQPEDMTQEAKAGFSITAGLLAILPVSGLPPALSLLLLSALLIKADIAQAVVRGQSIISARQLQKLLARRQAQNPRPDYPLLEIGGVQLPNDLENLSFFLVGSPGSGKTQGIKKLLSILRNRPDFRVMVLDRNGELMESFYDEATDLLFNPKDARSVSWSHVSEGQQAETIGRQWYRCLRIPIKPSLPRPHARCYPICMSAVSTTSRSGKSSAPIATTS